MSYFIPEMNRRGQIASPGSFSGGEFRVIHEGETIILQGESDTYDLPDPPGGSMYEYIEFEFLSALGAIADTLSDLNAVNRSSGKYIHDSTDNQSSWYDSLYIGTDGEQWYGGGNVETTAEVTTVSVGVVHKRNSNRVWSIEYDPDENQLSFYRAGRAASANNHPIVYNALITGYLI